MFRRWVGFSWVVWLAVLGLGSLKGQTVDPGWPRVFKKDGQQLTVYQPQVDYWRGYTNLHFRCAIAVKGVTAQERFGVAEIEAVTVTDQVNRFVALVPVQREVRFPNASEADLALLRQAVDRLRPPGEAITISLDRVIACLNSEQHPVAPAVPVNLDPPRIFYSRQPAMLLSFLGEPRWVGVETNRNDLQVALNANWLVLFEPARQQYYLLNGNYWLTAPDVRGPWTADPDPPASFATLPATEAWQAARASLPGKVPKVVPVVFVSTQPAELILTEGAPTLRAIPGTQLSQVTDTESVLFYQNSESFYYYLVAGRWFRAPVLEGPWTAASQDLPAEFARIPDNDPAAFVKASVPGTREARDAVLLASIPEMTTVNLTNATVNVVYSGSPQFVSITNTVVQAAVNSPQQVFLVGGSYYCCDSGVWFCSAQATGPWSFCTSVPPAIYTIPASNPNYNVTYVVVQSATPTTVTYSQTGGYSGQYVAATGVVMFGAGLAVGAALANNTTYYYPPPCHYSYGYGATYHYGYGGYYGASSTVYGPYGSASRAAAYNPYTGTSAAGRSVSTPYGTVSQGAAYNPYTGARAAGGSVSTATGSASRAAAYNPTTGNAAWGGTRSGEYGSAAAVQTSSGAGAASWDTANSQGKVAKTSSGEVYATNGDTVYKKDSSGGWSQNSGSGWQSVPSSSASSTAARTAPSSTSAGTPSSTASRTAPASTSSWSEHSQNLESQAQNRSWGNQQHESTQSWRSSGGSSATRSRGGRR